MGRIPISRFTKAPHLGWWFSSPVDGCRRARPEDGLEVAGVAADRADGDHHVEDLLEREVVADFPALLCGDEEWPAGGEDPGAAVVEDGVVPVGLLEQLGADVVLLVQADLTALPFSPHGFTTVLGLGLIHLFDDAPELVGKLRAQLAPGGKLYLAGLVAETRRAGWYLKLLHRAGEIATPRTSEELYVQLGRPAEFSTTGCMAYATLPAA